MTNITFMASLKTAALKASAFFEEHLDTSGQYPCPLDLACYYKHPMMYWYLNKLKQANQVLDFIRDTFLREDGDFRPNNPSTAKSEIPAYQEYYPYPNGWIVRAAQRLDRKDMLQFSLPYLTQYHDPVTKGFHTHKIDTHDGISDLLTSAHLGLVHLEAGKTDIAIHAGDYLCDSLSCQPKLNAMLYLRRDQSRKCVTHFPEEMQPFHLIDNSKPDQLYFMAAYPIAYLCLLYKKAKHPKYLEAAKQFADFTLSCNESVYASEFSHKLAWALSLLNELTPNPIYTEAVKRIANYFISIQNENGLWFSNDPLKCYDQSAEIAAWLIEIHRKL